MRTRSRGRGPSVIAGLLVAGVLSGCATAPGGADPSPTRVGPPPASEGSVVSPAVDPAALQRARAWLDAAVVPDGAVEVEADTVASVFSSYQSWPCRPVAELTGYWRLRDADLADTATWIATHPTPGLTVPLVPDYPAGVTGELNVGQLPTPDSQEGIVFSVAPGLDGDLAIRAQVAALAESATCADPGPGARWGAPGQG